MRFVGKGCCWLRFARSTVPDRGHGREVELAPVPRQEPTGYSALVEAHPHLRPFGKLSGIEKEKCRATRFQLGRDVRHVRVLRVAENQQHGWELIPASLPIGIMPRVGVLAAITGASKDLGGMVGQ